METRKNISKEEIKKLIGYKPIDEKLYQNAFVHKSVSKSLNTKSNETLEFVGDSVISIIVAEYLYTKYPDENEGFLTRVRTKLVSSKGLAKLATILKLSDFVIMNEKAMKLEWNTNQRILEDAFEALMGALYLDKGLEYCKKFLVKLIEKHLDFNDVVIDTNYKDILMRNLQSKGMPVAIYNVTHQSGPDHSKAFTVQIQVGNHKLSEGTAKNKKEAEQNAAFRALKGLGVLK